MLARTPEGPSSFASAIVIAASAPCVAAYPTGAVTD